MSVDYGKAFDLFFFFENKELGYLEIIYEDGTITIKLHRETDEILNKKGCQTPSHHNYICVTFGIYSRKLKRAKKGIKIMDEHLNSPIFAVDIVLLSESANEHQQLVN